MPQVVCETTANRNTLMQLRADGQLENYGAVKTVNKN